MSLVSPDNQQLTARVARIRAGYANFETTLRGAVAEVLNGLGNGVYNLGNMNRPIDAVADAYLSSAREHTLEDLGNVSESALKTSRAETDSDVVSKALVVADALYKGFAVEVEKSLERAVAADVKAAQWFIRNQMIQGRFVATTEQLTHELEFNIQTGKMNLATQDFVAREVNWAYRQQYNTIMVHVLLGLDTDVARIDGGSHDGEEMNLLTYDVAQARIFHHNSKSLLQPLDVGI
jgi:hypothetical protein